MKDNSAPTSKSSASRELWPGFSELGNLEYEIKSAHADVRLFLSVGIAKHAVERIHDAIRQAELLAFQAGRLSILRHRTEEEND